ncbi:MAG: hypothetical protein PHS92_02100 [Candidatus Gracilibacteria bacterium]|nr:hypothetical protein [Candidatus Gracilibacteria bacterium]
MASYGLEIIVGAYGTGKSFFTHRSITNWFGRNTIRIGNYCSPDFHLQFRSVKDLIEILQAINNFKKDPKNLKQKIEIIIDEGALYFGNREFKTFPKGLLSFLVQLRKLNVNTKIILQDLKMADITFRRLCYNVRKYYVGMGFIRFYKDFELLSEDANLNDPINSLVSRPYFKLGPWLTVKIFGLVTRFFGSSLYDTNEVILPYNNILDNEKLLRIFPYTKRIESDEDYKQLIKDKEKAFFEAIKLTKNKKLYKHYFDIYNYNLLT